MKQIENIFRAYDIRGVYGKELNPEIVARIGTVFGNYIGIDKNVCVGSDVRTTSDAVSMAFMSGLLSSGVNVTYIGLVPIPISNFTTWNENFDFGAYITASHNPPEYNGIRFRHDDGSGFTYENVEMKKKFFEEKVEVKDWKNMGKFYGKTAETCIHEYIKYASERINFKRKVRVALDPGNGATAVAAPTLFKELGGKVFAINDVPNGSFPGRSPHPKPGNIISLQNLVRDNRCELGVAYDGDGDRAVFVDDLGRVVQVEKIGVILTRYLIEKYPTHPKRIIANISCSMILEREMEKIGVDVMRVRVGDVFISEAIKKHRAVFAIEVSSHYFIPPFYVFDDPLIASALLAECISSTDTKFSQLVNEIESYPVIERTVKCSDNIKFEVIESLKNKYISMGMEVDITDGIKVQGDDYWVLMRASNTQPMIRIFVEAKNETLMKEKLGEAVNELENEIKKKT